jgi:lipid-A-disaccharide synthase
MMRSLKIAIIAGEESGDLLGADLVEALREIRPGLEIELSGVGGEHLRKQGLTSLFDPAEIALMGITAIVAKLPRLFSLIGKTASHIASVKPDCLIIIDNPDFTHRVARKVRAADASIPVINYVCPSVWAWRPGRAKAMAGYIDHVLAILPFEPKILGELGGPPATFVGHRLAQDPRIADAAWNQSKLEALRRSGGRKTIVVLPGSRSGEVRRHAAIFGETLHLLKQRGMDFDALLPVTDHVAPLVRSLVKDWPVQPVVIEGTEAKYEAFGRADAAIAASGTVTFELALCGVPLVSSYRLDPIAKFIGERFVASWTASLPNLIADAPVVPEFYNAHVRASMLARHVEALVSPGLVRSAMLDGYTKIRDAMVTQSPSGRMAAEIVLRYAEKSGAPG